MSLQYKGLILGYCPKCKRVTAFCSKEEIKGFSCRTCHTFIHFTAVAAGVICNCECGQRIKAVTNCEEDHFEFNCKCGYPLDVEYLKNKHRYVLMR